MQAGPSGSSSPGSSDRPSGPPSKTPSGPPSSRPSGPPSGLTKGPPRRSVSSPFSDAAQMDDAAYDRLAKQNIARETEINRREKVISLKKIKNDKRNNVILLLLLVAVFGGLALWPFSQGDLSRNPHKYSQEVDIIKRNDKNQAAAWGDEDLDLMSKKVWDGNDQFSGSITHDLILPGIPLDIQGVTTIPVDVKLISYRVDGANTGFRLALFPNTCANIAGQEMVALDERYVYTSINPMIIGQEITISFEVPAGFYCVVFEYETPPAQQGFRATIDAEITPHWNQPIGAPVAGLMALLASFAGIGAHKAAKAWKKVAQPDSPTKKSTEEEVIEQAEEERGAMSQSDDIPVLGESPEPSSDPSEQLEGTSQDTPEETSQAEQTPETTQPAQEQTPDTATPTEPEYTDDELRALGWTDQQIEWHRQGEAM